MEERDMKLRVVVSVVVACVLMGPARPAEARFGSDAPKLSSAEKKDLRRLIKRVSRGKRIARERAAREIAKLGPKAASAVPALERVLKDKSESLRAAALEALGAIGNERAVKVLGERFSKTREVALQRVIAGALGELGEAALAALPKLTKGLESESQDVQRECAVAIGKIGADGEDQRAGLRALLEADDERLKVTAAIALCDIGAGDSGLVSLLAETAAAPRKLMTLRLGATGSLQKLGAQATPATGALVRVLEETFVRNPALPYNAAQKLQHDKLRCGAARALGAIGAGAVEAIPSLERCLEETAIAGAAREAIGRIQA